MDDGTITKAPHGGKGTGPNPTDRSKSGTKRSILVEGKGIPLAVAVAGANRHDMKLAEPTLKSIVIERPKPTKKHPQNLCLDKAYDFPEVDELVADWGYPVTSRGEESTSRRERGSQVIERGDEAYKRLKQAGFLKMDRILQLLGT